MRFKYAIILYSLFLIILLDRIYSQGQAVADDSYRLYLTQIAASEAFLQLNLVSTANQYLDACEEKYRDVEWYFLKAALDQSARSFIDTSITNFTSIKLSPDGKLLAAAGSDGVITCFSYPGLESVRSLKGHKSSVSTLDFNSDGTKLASGGRDHTVIIWDTETGNVLAKNDQSFSQGIYQVRFSFRDSLLGVVSWERIPDMEPSVFGFAKLLDVLDASEILRVELDNHPAAGIVFTPDMKSMIVSTWGEITYGLNIETGVQKWNYDLSEPSEYNAFHAIDISPDGEMVALGSADHRVHILDANDGRVIHRIEPWMGHKKLLKAVSFSPDGKYLATAGEDQTILIWETAGWERKFTLTGHTGTVTSLAWAKNGNALLSTSLDGTIREWDLLKPFEKSYEICDFGPWQTPVSTDKKFFAAPCSDKNLVIYEAATGNPLARFGEQSGLCADISKNSKFLVTASFDGVVRLWDIQSEKEIQSFSGHTARVDGVCYLDAREQVLSVGDTTLRVWNSGSENEVHITGFKETPFRIALSPDESKAFIGFANGMVKCLETGTFRETWSVKHGNAIQEMAVSPDGGPLAIFAEKDIVIIDTQTGEPVRFISENERAGYGIGFSPDCRYLVTGSYDQTFKLWNLERGVCTLSFHGYEDVIYNTKFLSEKELFLSSSQGRIWYYHF